MLTTYLQGACISHFKGRRQLNELFARGVYISPCLLTYKDGVRLTCLQGQSYIYIYISPCLLTDKDSVMLTTYLQGACISHF